MLIQQTRPLCCELFLPVHLCSAIIFLSGVVEGVLEVCPEPLHFILKVYDIFSVQMI